MISITPNITISYGNRAYLVDTRLDATRLKANNLARVRHYTAGQPKLVKIVLEVEAFDEV